MQSLEHSMNDTIPQIYCNMNKHCLRQLCLTQRLTLVPEQLEQVSQAVSNLFFKQFNISNINYLHTFLPILKKHEINTWLIIKHLRENYPHLKIVVPKIHWSTYDMESYLLTPESQVIDNAWGIPEPIDASPLPHQEQIDMVLLPLLGFDAQGFRVGYGKGFYDRFLSKCRKDVVKVGLGLDKPIERIEDVHANDIRMDFCITDKKVFCFSSSTTS